MFSVFRSPVLRASVVLLAMTTGAQAQVACLPINDVKLDGVTLLPSVAMEEGLAGFEGRCLGVKEFDQILELITLAYVERGYVLSRAYLPEQDLSGGSLTIAVVEGALSDIRINGRHKPGQQATAFPKTIGLPVNLRQIEQGLEQLQVPPRSSATMEFTPGQKTGESILDVTAHYPKPFELRLNTNNNGQKPTGLWISGVEGDFGNVLGLNEKIGFSFTKSVGPSPFHLGYAGDRNRSASLSFDVPYGYWNFGAELSASDYKQTLPGIIDPIPVKGSTHAQSLTVKHLFQRDEKTKSTVELAFGRHETANFIQDSYIKSSSRITYSLRTTIGHTRPLFGGQLSASAHLEQGYYHRFLGATSESRTALPYFLAGFQADYGRAFDLGGHKISWMSNLKGQWSPDQLFGTNDETQADRLFGAQQFSVGGQSTVRGTRVALATGSSGLFWRNELEYAVPRPIAGGGKLKLYSGLDWGWVAPNDRQGVDGGRATGGVLGVKFDYGQLHLDMSYQKILATSRGLQKPESEWFLSAKYTF